MKITYMIGWFKRKIWIEKTGTTKKKYSKVKVEIYEKEKKNAIEYLYQNKDADSEIRKSLFLIFWSVPHDHSWYLVVMMIIIKESPADMKYAAHYWLSTEGNTRKQ